MLPVIDPNGESTARRIMFCSLLLIPISLVPHLLGMTGALYAAAAVADSNNAYSVALLCPNAGSCLSTWTENFFERDR
jgi:heme O synthase-like polyprenyltransferase